MINIKLFNRSELEHFIESDEFVQLKAIPISIHRAVSHINNPRANDKDILLIVAYSEGEVVGYLGTIPDTIFIAGLPHRCAVISCIWVKPELRKTEVSMNLLKSSRESYELIFGSDYVPATIKMYNRSGLFTQELKLDGVRVYMRMDLHTILPPKRKLFRIIKPLLLIADEVVNFFWDFRFRLFKSRIKQSDIEYINEIDEESGQLIAASQDKQLFKRGKDELNWIIRYPWILTDGSRDDSRYYFTSVDNDFGYYNLKLFNNKHELIAFVMLSKRNRVLKIPFCYMKPGAVEDVAKIIVHHIYKWKINTFITHHPLLSPYFLNKNIGQIFRKKSYRLYLFSKELYSLLNNMDFEIQDGDADAVFI